MDHLIKSKIKYLEERINFHNHEYFVLNKTSIQDNEFDRLVEELRSLKPNSPVLLRIGSDLNFGTKINHTYPMLSLDKCYNLETFSKWFNKIKGPIIGMFKIDGIACSIHYSKNGLLKFAITRGDGKEGEDITENILQIIDIPSKIENDKYTELEVRGEVYLEISQFEKYYKKRFSNPRNFTAGVLKQKEIKKLSINHLSFFAYDIYGTDFKNEIEKFDYLKIIGFKIVPVKLLKTTQECESFYQLTKSQKENINFEIDGVVFRANLKSEQDRLGLTTHHPRWSIAYKFQSEYFETKLLNIQWSIGRTGMVTPIASFEPVIISGAKISRASLHNLNIFNKLKLRNNSIIEIVRSGNVIPYVNKVLRADGNLFQHPDKCPSCNNLLSVNGDYLLCRNLKDCPDIITSKLIHFSVILGFNGFGKQIIYQLVKTKILKEPADFYRITKQQLCSIKRIGEKLASKLISRINDKKNISLENFLLSLGLGELGASIAKTISNHFKNIENILCADIEDFEKIFGIGKSISTSIVSELKTLKPEIENLLDQIQIEQQKISVFNKRHLLFNKTILFTGSLEQFDRKEAQKRAEQFGCKISSSVTNSTDYLVCGKEKHGPSLKYKMAKRIGVKILSEKEFLKLIIT